MNKGQKTGLGLNFIGLVLFVIWFIVRNLISTTVSIIFAVIFLGLLVTSLITMIRATRQTQEISKENNSKQG
jgi:ABC-type enterochelin transport system permease subunit